MAEETKTAPQAQTNQIPQDLNPQQALNILIQAVHLAQNKGGVYTLEDAEVIARAVKVFVKKEEPIIPAIKPEQNDITKAEKTETPVVPTA